MKRIRFEHIGIAALLLMFVVACNPEGEDVKLDFSVTIPENWDGTILANQGLVYAAGRELQDEADTIPELLYVVKESLSNYNLSSYYNALMPNIQNPDSYISSIYASDTVINSINFKKLISHELLKYSNPVFQDTFDLDVITDRYFFFEGGNGYNMVFFSIDTLYFKQNRAIFNDVMHTFEYLP